MTLERAPRTGGLARAGAALFAVGLFALGAFGLVFYARLPRRLPAPRDWQSAAAVLSREARPGDAVALSPWWAERARQAVPAGLPVLAFPHLAGEDLPGVRRVWLLAIPAAPGYRRDLARELADRSGAVASPVRIGGLELTRHDLRDPVLPLALLSNRLDTARVESGGRACPRDDAGTFRCPGAGTTVAREVREVDFVPRTCVVVHPAGLAAPLSVAFREVPVGRALRVHAGVVGLSEKRYAEAYRLTVTLDGQQLGAPAAPVGWHAVQLDTSGRAGRAGQITFTIRANAASRRELCFDAFTLP